MTSHGSTIVREVISSTGSGADVMSALPGLVRQLLDKEAWRAFTIPGGQPVRHETFSAFAQAEPPRGLGGRKNQLVALCGTDEDLADKVRSLLYGETQPASEHRGRTVTERNTRVEATNSSITKGNSADYYVSRLKRDDPELAKKVIAGQISPNAAAREKGWRKPRVVVSSPERVAASLLKYMSADDIAKLVAALIGKDG